MVQREQFPEACLLLHQFSYGAHHAEFTSRATPRPHTSEELVTQLALFDQLTPHHSQDEQSDRHQGKHPLPCLYIIDPSISKSKHPFAVTKPFFAREPACVFRAGSPCRERTVRDQVPHLPFTFSITRSALHQIDATRICLAVPQPSPSTSSLVATQTQAFEFFPFPINHHLDVVFRANDEGNAQKVEQIEQLHISKGTISRQDKAFPVNRRENISKQISDEISLQSTPAILQLTLIVSAPKQWERTPPDDHRSDQQVLSIFNGPVNGESQRPHSRQLIEKKARMAKSEGFDLKPLVMQEAREPLECSLGALKESSNSCLRAGLHIDDRHHEIDSSFDLMTMCVGQQGIDILDEASG